jgi:hypothetical protein
MIQSVIFEKGTASARQKSFFIYLKYPVIATMAALSVVKAKGGICTFQP